MFLKRLSNRGDTIIEVMLAIIVVGSVLAGAYVSSNRSLKANRGSEERSEALKLVEGQLEQLRSKIASVAGNPGPYCFDKTTGAVDTITLPAGSTNLSSDNFAGYPGGCNYGAIAGGYHMAVSYASGNYTVQAHWDGSDGRQQISTVYRAEQ